MPMLEQRIQQQFYDSADLIVQVCEQLSKPIADAVEVVVTCITAGGKILLAGLGPSMADAQYAAALLGGTFERSRPALPALVLASDATSMSALAQASGNLGLGLGRQVQALGLPGDVLVLFDVPSVDADPDTRSLASAIEAAHGKDMSVVLLTAAPPAYTDAPPRFHTAASSSLTDTDVCIAVPTERSSLVTGLHRLSWHCICDAIDLELLGEQAS